ncbi:MAG: DNA polymerase III subunit alpha [Simkaniaceae bacterium]|nr:DNA polymerase III subunit alpha [Simkaniaceae bacterium]
MYIPLHVHSQYSVLGSSATLKGLVAKAKGFGMPALALTDSCNMFGAVDFYKACTSADIKPIIGLEMMLAPTSRTDKKRQIKTANAHPLTLLAKDDVGYRNLCKITSVGYLEGFYYTPRIDKEFLSEHSEGLICLSGSTRSMLAALIDDDEALREEIKWYRELFGDDYYFELQRHKMSDAKIKEHGMSRESWLVQKHQAYVEKQEKVYKRLLELSGELSIPCVGTGEVYYLEPDDWRAQEILMNVSSGEPCEIWERDAYGTPKNRILNPKRSVLSSHEYYFKSPEEMAEVFSDAPQVLENTLAVAEKCQMQFDFKKKFYPVFVPPSLEGKEYAKEERVEESEKYLMELCTKGIEARYDEAKLAKVKEVYPDEEPLDVVKKRLEYEIGIITSKGLCDYLLIVHDFIFWAKSQGIPVGPGRGSGVGSIILYLIGVTDIEPLRFSLFFERFINPERLSYPDIDVDICMERRSEVIDYTLKKYGTDKVAQIITFGTMKAKMAIKDVGRVLSVSLGKVNQIAKLVPDDLNITLEKALEIDPDFADMYESDEDAKRVIDIARKLEGSIRNTGIHAAGIIICGDPLTDHIPVCNAKDSDILVTQYSMKPVETVGMLKIDFLGLKTLTCIQKAANAVEEATGNHIDWVNLHLDDSPTFDLLNQGQTLGIFQLESSGMQDLARQLHIDKFEEIIAVGALYRPGPMEMIPSFCRRKHGKEEIEIDHPLMKDILLETYGIIVYQEQVMAIAQRLAGYSLGEGDVLRRAMGKKDKQEMAKQGEKFKSGAEEHGLEAALAMTIFEKVEKFASYGFNKSHATAYAFITYITAFFKANYPGQWMAALMSCDLDDIGKVAKHIRECQAMNIAILSPDVNESAHEFVATASGIRFSLNAIKGVGESVVDAILAARPYQSLYDFMQRIDHSRVGKKVIEILIDAGAFDFTGDTRAGMQRLLQEHFDAIVKEQKEKKKGIMDLFSDGDQAHFKEPKAEAIEGEKLEILKREKELIGFYLTGHPIDEFKEIVDKLEITAVDQLDQMPDKSVVKTVFVIETCNVRISNKTQKKFAILTISNGIERFELPVWPELFAHKGHLLDENALILAVLILERNEGDLKLQCRWLDSLPEVDEAVLASCNEAVEAAQFQVKMRSKKRKQAPKEPVVTKKVHVKVDIDKVRLTDVLKLRRLFSDFAGDAEIHLNFISGDEVVNKLFIDSHSGIEWCDTVEKFLLKLPFCQSAELTE